MASRETEMIIIMMMMMITIPPPIHFSLVTSVGLEKAGSPHPLPPPDAAVKMRLGTE